MEVLEIADFRISENYIFYEGISHFYIYTPDLGGVRVVREYLDGDDIRTEDKIFSCLSRAIAWIEKNEI